MKTAAVALEKLFWMAVATVPWFPIYVLGTFNPQLSCADNEDCLNIHFAVLLNREGQEIVLLVAFLLWPLCVWKIVGKHLWPGIDKRMTGYLGGPWPSAQSSVLLNSSDSFHLRIAAVVFGKLYWLAAACIPLFLWYLLATLHSPSECVDNGTCYQFLLPLNDVSVAAVSLAACLLWPMCAWQLAGKHIWGHETARNCSDLKANANDKRTG